jgi:ABC-type transport system involved in multi-copper enzyme maturation permease subunit
VAVGTLIIGQLVLGALTACFGLGLGMALRSLPGGITAVFALALVLPLIFQAKASLNGLARILPYGELSAAALALGSSPANSGPQLATAAAGVLLLAWTTSVCVIALARFLREDI